MEQQLSSSVGNGTGFALVEVLTTLAILSVLAIIAFLMFFATDVEDHSEELGSSGEPHVSTVSRPLFPTW